MTGQAHPLGRAPAAADAVQRLDKWLWFARIFKSRTLAAQMVQDGKVRINRAKVAKPAQTVRPDDVLTIAVRGKIQVVRVLAPGSRRGPPAEARLLYELLSAPDGPATAPPPAGSGERNRGTGRPSKRDRRLTDRLTENE
jgi:ribosome-associated heat shock protein Hsp15